MGCYSEECKAKAGDPTRGFFREEDIIPQAQRLAASLFNGEEYVIIQAEIGTCSAMPLLHWPKRLDAAAQKANALAEEWRRIGGYEGQQEERADEIDKEWQDIIEKEMGVCL